MTSVPRSSRIIDATILVVGIVMAVFQLASTQHLFVSVYQFYNIHLGFSLALVFLLLMKKSGKGPRVYMLVLLALSLGVAAYMGIYSDDLAANMGYPEGADFIFCFALIFVVEEAARRSGGYVFPILAAIFALYGFFGYKLPAPMTTAYLPWDSILSRLSLFTGIYGMGISVSSNYIFLFVMFGALIQNTGAPRFFEEFSKLFGSRLRGGGAMTAVVSSCAFGMVSGSATSNVATTGAFTIPLMKRLGYQPHQAGAIEAVASSGGQIMPPVLGTAAFLMADLTGIPYIRIAVASIIPAMLYYLSCGVYVQLQAVRLNITPTKEKIDYKELLLSAPSFLLPLGVLTVFLVLRFSVQFSIFWTILMLIVISLFRKKDRRPLKTWLSAAANGSVTGAQIAVICALLGLVIGPIEMTGLGVKLPSQIVALAGGNVGFILFLTMIVSLILGCGVPSPVAYMLVGMTAAPALVKVGIDLLQAHYFVFYFACLSMVTPPVAMAAFVASGLAKSNYFQTGIEASKISLGCFIVPFLTAFAPCLLIMPQAPLSTGVAVISSICIVVLLQFMICGYFLNLLSMAERLFFLVPVFLFILSIITGRNLFFLGGIALTAASVYKQILKRQKRLLPVGVST